MAKAVSAAAKACADASMSVKPPGLVAESVEAQMAEHDMQMSKLSNQCHQLQMQNSQKQFQLQIQQLKLLKAEMDERTDQLALRLELERLKRWHGADSE
jgi:hypothetical protein